jgi:hypothetical protein
LLVAVNIVLVVVVPDTYDIVCVIVCVVRVNGNEVWWVVAVKTVAMAVCVTVKLCLG